MYSGVQFFEACKIGKVPKFQTLRFQKHIHPDPDEVSHSPDARQIGKALHQMALARRWQQCVSMLWSMQSRRACRPG